MEYVQAVLNDSHLSEKIFNHSGRATIVIMKHNTVDDSHFFLNLLIFKHHSVLGIINYQL